MCMLKTENKNVKHDYFSAMMERKTWYLDTLPSFQMPHCTFLNACEII